VGDSLPSVPIPLNIVPAAMPSPEDLGEQPSSSVRASSHSSSLRESSLPQIPAGTPEAVKNIFQEFMSVRKWEEIVVDYIQSTFGGDRVVEFVDELSRQVCHMPTEEQQKTAGSLIKMLLKKGLTNKAQVIQSLKDGVIVEIPDIEVDVPKVASHLAVFLVELFMDEEDLSWLVSLGEGIQEVFSSSWADLVSDTLNILKLRRSEETVQVLYKKTQGANRLPIQEIPWVAGDTVEPLAQKMKTVLETSDNVLLSCSEHSWDIRKELTTRSLIEAFCRVCWKKDGAWDAPLLHKLLPQVRLQSSKLHRPIFRQAKEFIKRNNIDKIKKIYTT